MAKETKIISQQRRKWEKDYTVEKRFKNKWEEILKIKLKATSVQLELDKLRRESADLTKRIMDKIIEGKTLHKIIWDKIK